MRAIVATGVAPIFRAGTLAPVNDVLLSASGLTKTFGDFTAVDDLDLRVPRGSFFALLGPSGCGKTTLLRVVAGFMHLGDGEVRLDDEVIASPRVHLPPERRGIGYVIQSAGLLPHRTVVDNVATVPVLTGTPPADTTRTA